MAKQISASGILTIAQDACLSGGGQDQRQLNLGPSALSSCSSPLYVEEVAQNSPTIATTGAVGAAFEDLDAFDGLSEITYLYIRSNANIMLRIFAVPAVALASAGAYPTGFAGGETLIVTIDGTVVTVTFDAADQTVDQVVARINAAMALAGIATPRATAVSGQVQITGVATAVNGTSGVLSFAGTGAAQIGFDGTEDNDDAQGQDIPVYGLTTMQFPTTGGLAPTKIQISGQATLDIVAGGRS